MSNKEKFFGMTFKMYNEALRLLERGDIYDAAEKAWCAVENARKMFLVSLGVPEDKAGSVEFGVSFFIRILKGLGRTDLIDQYYNLDYTLHIKGFYEAQIPPDILREKILEAEHWINNIIRLVDKIKRVDLKNAIRLMDEALKIKRKILRMDLEYNRILQQINATIAQAISRTK